MIAGVDIGGTFTDIVIIADGVLRVHKLLSTPSAPERAMIDGLTQAGGALDGFTRIAHGTTVATNAILERKGARCALITTGGFRDLLLIGRQDRPQLYALHPTINPPLIPRECSFDIPERLDYQGNVITPLDLDALDTALDAVVAAGVESVAVCFLYSFVNPEHERVVRDRIRARGLLDESQIALSHEVLPEFREYERASATALEAYVRPVISRYLSRLEAALPQPDILRVMKSDGGVIHAAQARERAILTALSGPAAGVIGAFHLAQLAGFDQIITLDMGGTSTDVALCPGQPIRRAESEIDGLPLRMRLLDIETVGAGGGSIARLDSGGALRVGPESAGADPGPMIYGRGGDHLTVSDANALLGRLAADHFLGGAMRLDLEAARQALAQLADDMYMSPDAAARGIIALANANIDRAIRKVSIARGYDPRAFTLVAFGGAGGLHACEVAEQLDMRCVLIPRYPGVLCAFGLLVADVTREYSQSVLHTLNSETPTRLHSTITALTEQARADLLNEGITPQQIIINPLIDARYRGQAYELTIPYGDDLAAALHQAHEAAYGHAFYDRPIEIVNARVQAVGMVEKPAITREAEAPNDGSNAIIARKAYPIYAREQLQPGAAFAGAALIVQMDSTTYIPAGWSARVDGFHNLILTRE